MNERMMILKMLEEGKITLEEADALLEALGMSDEPGDGSLNVTNYSSKHNYEDVLEELQDEFDRMEEELDQVEEELEEQLEELHGKVEEITESAELDVEKKLALNQKIQEVQAKLEEKRSKVEERRAKLREKQKEYEDKCEENPTGSSSEIHQGIDEMSRGIKDFAQTIERDGIADVRHAMHDIATQINDGMRELRSGLNEGAREVHRALKGGEFRDMLNNFFRTFSLAGLSCITLEEDLTGTFDLTAGPVIVDLKTSNGKIEVVGTDETDYKLHLKYEIHADSEQEAAVLKDKMCTITQSANALEMVTHGWHGSVSVKLLVPRKTEGDIRLKTSNGVISVSGLQSNGVLDLSSSNGRLELSDLRVKEIKAQTSNGRIEAKDYAAEKVEAHTSNGSIYLDGLCANIKGRTSNGTITVYPHVTDAGSLDLHTSNGRIKVIVRDQEVGVDLDTNTSMGGITLDFANLVYQTHIEKHMRREYRAKSEGYDACKHRLQVKAVTSMGGIYIGKADF